MMTKRREFVDGFILALLASLLSSETQLMQSLESFCGSVKASEAVAIEDVGHP
jgi:hypothetical protein